MQQDFVCTKGYRLLLGNRNLNGMCVIEIMGYRACGKRVNSEIAGSWLKNNRITLFTWVLRHKEDYGL